MTYLGLRLVSSKRLELIGPCWTKVACGFIMSALRILITIVIYLLFSVSHCNPWYFVEFAL